MFVESLHLIEKKIDILVEQTKTNSQETLQFKTNISSQTNSFDFLLSLEKDKLLLTLPNLTFFNSIFKITKTNINFSLLNDGFWTECPVMK